MICLSINYKNAPSDVRSRFSFDIDKRREFREKLGNSVILCTCNRTELYFTGAEPEYAAELLSRYSGIADITGFLRIYAGDTAERHLFRVACGIDSMLVGEDEILRQVKDAYAEASAAGRTDFELNTVFQAAVTCAKRVKTETPLSKTPVSAATIAANEAAKLGESVNVLMIGASGRIGSSTLKNLLPHTNVHITQTARTHSAGYVCYENVETVPYERRYEYMEGADCVISATASPHFTVTASGLRDALRTDKPRLFIDLAVPPDIDRAVTGVNGVRLLGIDDLGELAKQNNVLRLSAAEQAEVIITGELDEMRKKLAFHAFLPELDSVRGKAGQLTFDEIIYRLRDGLDSGQFSAVLEVLRDMEV